MTQLTAKKKSRQTMVLTAKWHTEELKNLHKKNPPRYSLPPPYPKKNQKTQKHKMVLDFCEAKVLHKMINIKNKYYK